MLELSDRTVIYEMREGTASTNLYLETVTPEHVQYHCSA